VITSLLHHQQRVEPKATRSDLIQALRSALSQETGVAAGKLGLSEQALLLYPTLLERCHSSQQRLALTLQTRQHCAVQMGIFPNTQEAVLSYSQLHAQATRELDFLGLVGGRLEADLLDQLQPNGQTIGLLELEPNRSVPDQSVKCYLPELRGKRVLIVSSIAELLCQRATQAIFEAVWAKSGKPWFAPAEVLPMPFPYCYDVHTQRRFGRSEHLLEWIVEQIDPATFDLALIAGSSLGIPIAAAIKAMNRSALALGGALQVLFGVGGQRWWSDPHWQNQHITPAWISVPADHVPQVAGGYVDGGAYWW
jgi:hypothetical protein